MDNNSNKNCEKIITFIMCSVLIIAVLSIIAVFSGAIMHLLGFEYESVGSFILYFVIASIVSYPMNLIAGALPKALLNLDRITRKTAVCVYVLLDTITTFFGFYIVDYFMPSISANTVSLIVAALGFALLGMITSPSCLLLFRATMVPQSLMCITASTTCSSTTWLPTIFLSKIWKRTLSAFPATL